MNFYCCVDGNVSPSTIHSLLFCSAWTKLSMYCGHHLWSVYSMAFTVLGFFLNVSGVIASCNVYIVICSNGKRTWMTLSTYSAFSLSFKLYILFNSILLFVCVEVPISLCVSEGSIGTCCFIANASQDIWFLLVLHFKSEWHIQSPCTDSLINPCFMCFSCNFSPQIGLC